MSERDVTPRPPFRVNSRLVGIIVVVLLIIGFATTSFFVVDQTEEAVVLRLGRFERIAAPGLHFKLPFGIEQNYNVPTQVIQNMTFGYRVERSGVNTVFSDVDYPEESIMLTGDLNIVDVEWVVQYRIVNPQDWLFQVEDQIKTIRDITQSVVNRLVGDRAIVDVLGEQRPNIEVSAQEELNNLFESYQLGVTITAVRLQNIVPPVGRVQDAFEDVNRAVQDMNRFINEGRERYNQEIPRARGEAERIVQQAQGYAAERTNRAQGDVARFNSVLREYQNDPDTMRTRLYYEMVEDVFKDQEGTNLVDRELSNFIPLMNLPSGRSTGSAEAQSNLQGGQQ